MREPFITQSPPPLGPCPFGTKHVSMMMMIVLCVYKAKKAVLYLAPGCLFGTAPQWRHVRPASGQSEGFLWVETVPGGNGITG